MDNKLIIINMLAFIKAPFYDDDNNLERMRVEMGKKAC